jgi:hypothetical protein
MLSHLYHLCIVVPYCTRSGPYPRAYVPVCIYLACHYVSSPALTKGSSICVAKAADPGGQASAGLRAPSHLLLTGLIDSGYMTYMFNLKGTLEGISMYHPKLYKAHYIVTPT